MSKRELFYEQTSPVTAVHRSHDSRKSLIDLKYVTDRSMFSLLCHQLSMTNDIQYIGFGFKEVFEVVHEVMDGSVWNCSFICAVVSVASEKHICSLVASLSPLPYLDEA